MHVYALVDSIVCLLALPCCIERKEKDSWWLWDEEWLICDYAFAHMVWLLPVCSFRSEGQGKKKMQCV